MADDDCGNQALASGTIRWSAGFCPKPPCNAAGSSRLSTHACVLRKQMRCRAADRLLSSDRVS